MWSASALRAARCAGRCGGGPGPSTLHAHALLQHCCGQPLPAAARALLPSDCQIAGCCKGNPYRNTKQNKPLKKPHFAQPESWFGFAHNQGPWT
jgi:hypothetical protein